MTGTVQRILPELRKKVQARLSEQQQKLSKLGARAPEGPSAQGSLILMLLNKFSSALADLVGGCAKRAPHPARTPLASVWTPLASLRTPLASIRSPLASVRTRLASVRTRLASVRTPLASTAALSGGLSPLRRPVATCRR